MKGLLQYHSSKASVLQRSRFFMVQLSHLYKTSGKTIALTHVDLCQQRDISGFSMPSRFVIAFLPRSKCRLISWLQSPSTVNLSKKIKSVTASTFSTYICYEMMGPDAMILVFFFLILVFLNVEFETSFFTLLFHAHQEAL